MTRESLRLLLDLQRLDTALDRLAARLADLPEQRELDEVTERRDVEDAARAERQLELDALIREQTKLEHEISQIDEKVTRDQARLYSGEVNNPKELGNISAEVDALRKRKTFLEDQELEIMEQREELEKVVGGLTGSASALQASVAETTARRDAATTEIHAETAKLRGERDTLAPRIPEELLALYEEIRAKRDGVGAGALEEWTCRACSLPLTPMAREEIKTADDPLIRCENCRRILVIP